MLTLNELTLNLLHLTLAQQFSKYFMAVRFQQKLAIFLQYFNRLKNIQICNKHFIDKV